ncbi:MAG: single-stranded-DNA-specific exonuclease RecJ [Pseudomonadota bacterium]
MRIVRRSAADAARLAAAGMHPVLARVYAGRGITTAEQVDHRLRGLHPPDALGGMQRAVTLLAEAIRTGARIVVAGDFECDGATGCAVGVRGLEMLGAVEPDFVVPHRAVHGYGLGPTLVESLRVRPPSLVVTVDNGIASHAGVAAANALGMQVVVTDHHLPGASLPPAAAIVNPNLPGDPFPSKALAGVGVLFYLLLATRARLRADGWFGPSRPEPDLAALLDLVALGTVADLVPLDRNNRTLVASGLRRIRSGAASAGISALFGVAGRSTADASASDLGYAIGPRVNAAGRLEDMSLGIRCLLARTPEAASALAARLDAINRERRELQAAMTEEAVAIADRLHLAGGAPPAGLCLFDPGWHAGVVGLVASRIKDRLRRPVFAFAPAGDATGMLRGSGRSIDGFHLRDALAEVDAGQPGLVERFGGHAMAAGITLAADRLAAFAAAFDAVAARHLGAQEDPAEGLSDGELPAAEATVALATLLRDAGPWGQAFPEPVFDGRFRVDDCRVLAGGHLRLRLRHVTCGTPVDAVQFGAAAERPPAAIRCAYQLGLDDWRGERRVRLLVRHVEPA